MRKVFLIAVSLMMVICTTYSTYASETNNMVDVSNIQVVVDYDQTKEIMMPDYTTRGVRHTFATTTPVYGYGITGGGTVHLGNVFCFSIFEFGIHKAISGYVDGEAATASYFSTHLIFSNVKKEYATSSDNAAQILHRGSVSIMCYGQDVTTAFQLAHYCNINDYCYSSTYSA